MNGYAQIYVYSYALLSILKFALFIFNFLLFSFPLIWSTWTVVQYPFQVFLSVDYIQNLIYVIK